MDTTTPTVLRVSEPREVLAYIPYRLGFVPRESLVLLGLRGPRNRIGLVIRADLADAGHAVHGPAYAQRLVGHLLDDGAHDAFVVVYTAEDRASLAGDTPVGRSLAHLRALVDWGDPPGPWVVGPDGYGVWGEDVECAPHTDPLRDLEYTQTGATMVLHGHAVAPDRASLAVERDAPAPARRAAARAAARAERHYAEVRHRCRTPGAAFGVPDERARHEGELLAWRRGERSRWERLLAAAGRGDPLPVPELGRMLVGLSDLYVRDDVILSLVGPPPAHLDDAEAITWALSQVFDPGGLPPEPVRTQPGERVLESLARCAPRGRAAPALTLLAWLAWWGGDGARADVLARQALAEDGDQRLAQLIAAATAQGMPPGWVWED
ncbi:DUF4192 domain-containing protein [Georgenia faecalis]|uniref:DUF4192 domain-containing protein n=1 Tax=Georgenia faecalis TaxID=2483799 RepID=A0ABV9DB12_9MICO|nr:DUF4192 domain-containing protein [Georgenia faecalis]